MALSAVWRLDYEPHIWMRKPWGGHCARVQGNRHPTQKNFCKNSFKDIIKGSWFSFISFIQGFFLFFHWHFKCEWRLRSFHCTLGRCCIFYDSKLYWTWLENKLDVIPPNMRQDLLEVVPLDVLRRSDKCREERYWGTEANRGKPEEQWPRTDGFPWNGPRNVLL